MNSFEQLEPWSWPLARLGEAIALLARRNGLTNDTTVLTAPPAECAADDDMLNRWVDACAAQLGVEAEPVSTSYAAAGHMLQRSGPAVLRFGPASTPRFLLLLEHARHVRVLGPDGTARRIDPALIAAALRAPLEATRDQQVSQLLDATAVPRRRRARARARLLEEQLSTAEINAGWLLRLPPGADFLQQMRHAGLPRQFAVFLIAYVAASLLWIGSWWLLGRAVLNGRLDWGWLYAWGLLLLTMLPLRIFSSWLQEQLVIGSGVLLKRRLLAGALNMEPDDIRHQGVGQLLGRVIESDAIEFLALSGGFPALKALIELTLAALILAAGAAGWLHTLLLIGWTGLLLLLIKRFGDERARWTDARLHMTHDLIEQMVGHRTLLAQQPRAQWHTGDDQRLEQYLGLSWAMDRTTAWLIALVPRGWLLASLVLLLPAVVAGSTLAGLAISVGATLLAFQAFGRLNIGSAYLAGALIAWQQVAPLFRAAARSAPSGGPLVLQPAATAPPAQRAAAAANTAQPLLSTYNLGYRYRADGPAVLSGCTMQMYAGERMLLEGPSGSGKSTLAALITGLRQPGAGLLLLRGLDRQTIGADGWRRQVAAAPQFHENHVLSETFAFNLLLGRRWPPRPQDMAEAEAICYDLGLGDLLERMPAGLLQIVGETGWQLSHGEKSRLYLARALLQDAALVVLDESFAALDPETLKLALNCALQRAPTLLVIAHP